MNGIAKIVVNFLGKVMKFWRVELTCGAETPEEVPTKREIYQGDVVISFIPLTHTENS